ncbi:MAG: hypothetical protein L0206_04055, partial [Actinobacteria bacterium]|nr:hypothetical protein [Actinomycetota bacterium]
MTTTGTVEIQMPQMGESVTEGTVLEWHKREGEFVEEGETVVEVSTDKVDAEVPAPASGTLAKVLKGEDETVQVGEALAELDPSGEDATGDGSAPVDDHPAAAEAGTEQAAGIVQLTMPEMGESVTEGTILEW